jgi:hypothetical protein
MRSGMQWHDPLGNSSTNITNVRMREDVGTTCDAFVARHWNASMNVALESSRSLPEQEVRCLGHYVLFLYYENKSLDNS